MRCSTSRVAAEYGSQGQAGVPSGAAPLGWKRSARRPWIILDRIPRPFKGAQYSAARFAGSVIQGNVIPGLRSLRSLTRGYLLLPLRGSLTRTSALTVLFSSRYRSVNRASHLKASGTDFSLRYRLA